MSFPLPIGHMDTEAALRADEKARAYMGTPPSKALDHADWLDAFERKCGIIGTSSRLLGIAAELRRCADRDDWQQVAMKAAADRDALAEELAKADIGLANAMKEAAHWHVRAIEYYAERDAARAAVATLREVLEQVASLPVAGAYPDGPCLDKYDNKDVVDALAKTADFAAAPKGEKP